MSTKTSKQTIKLAILTHIMDALACITVVGGIGWIAFRVLEYLATKG